MHESYKTTDTESAHFSHQKGDAFRKPADVTSRNFLASHYRL